MDVLKQIDENMPLKSFIDVLLGAALDSKDLTIVGHTNRGGCIVNYRLSIDSVRFHPAALVNPETKH